MGTKCEVAAWGGNQKVNYADMRRFGREADQKTDVNSPYFAAGTQKTEISYGHEISSLLLAHIGLAPDSTRGFAFEQAGGQVGAT